MPGYPGPDRRARRDRRRERRWKVTFCDADDENLDKGEGVTVNASDAGACICTNHQFAASRMLALRVEMAAGPVLLAKARVAWCKKNPDGEGFYIGVKYTEFVIE